MPIPNGCTFRCGRDASACISLVPRHRDSGGRNKIGKLSKQDGLSYWIRSQLATKNKNNTTVAVDNKMVRMAWAMLRSGNAYQVPVAR